MKQSHTASWSKRSLHIVVTIAFLLSLLVAFVPANAVSAAKMTAIDVIVAYEDFDGGALNDAGTTNVYPYLAGGGTGGDVFGIVSSGSGGTGMPYDVADDSVADVSGGGVNGSDALGLAGQYTTAFFAMNDMDAVAVNDAVWSFDISGADSITRITMDIAALGDFEASSSDGFKVEAQIDGGGYSTIFEAVTNEAEYKTYRAFDGGFVFADDDPLELFIDGSSTAYGFLDKCDPATGNFDTYESTLLNGSSGDTLDIRVSWAGTPSGSEPMGLDNFTIYGVLAEPDILISEFEPNPTGTDPANVSFEISGEPLAAFDLWVLSIESDSGTTQGFVQSAANITGTFDANGFAAPLIPDLENPSFTLILTDAFTGVVNTTDIDPADDGSADTSTMGTIYDAVGVSDTTGDDTLLYGATLGGTDILFNGYTEPFLAFRDGTSGDWYNVVSSSGIHVLTADGTELVGTDFDTDPTTSDTFNTFGLANPSYLGPTDTPPTVSSTDPADSATDVAVNSNVVIEFSEDVTVSAGWYDVTCASSGTHTVAVTGGPATYTLDPDTDFDNSEVCTVTIEADYVVDQDGTPDNMAADYIFDFTTTAGSQCGQPATLISAVQGSDAAASPVVGSPVTVEAVVVGDFQASDEMSGFFLQEEDADADGDPLSSEGVFIYDPSGTDVAVGDVVRLTGTVDEYYGNTQIKTITNLEICSSGNTAPTAATITFPFAATDDLEDVEGMLVVIPETLYVTETYTLGRYGEVDLSGSAVLDNPTNVAEPGAPALAVRAANELNRILLDDGSGVQNPPTVEHLRTTGDTLRLGDTVTGLTGVINYSYDEYRVQPIGDVVFSPDSVRPATPPAVDGSLKVASFNVLNYFTTIDTGALICGPSEDMECRGADSALELTRQRDKIIEALVLMDADVVGLIEIENHVTDAAVTDLVNGLNDATAPGTYAAIVTGPVGTDAIKQAIIYKPATVTPLGSFAVLDSSVDPTFLDTKNRPALAQSFTEIASGEVFTVVVNHLKSKGSDCNDVGDPDTGDLQGNCNITRTNAATALVNWLATDPTSSGDPDFLIIGDLNAYAMEDPVDAIKSGGYTDLVAQFDGITQLYSYVYDGEVGYLDHALSSATLTSQVTGTTHWHINADEPLILDYNTEYGQEALGLYVDDQYRSSDHDPVLVGLNLSGAPILVGPPDGTSTTDHTPNFVWEEVPGATAYVIQVSPTSDFSVLPIVKTVIPPFYAPGIAMNNNTYYWRVIAIVDGALTEWSEIRMITITGAPGNAQPVALSPDDGATTTDHTPTFDWEDVPTAVRYRIQISKTADFAVWLVNQTVTESEFTPGVWMNSGTYYWRVQAEGGGDSSWFSIKRQLIIE